MVLPTTIFTRRWGEVVASREGAAQKAGQLASHKEYAK